MSTQPTMFRTPAGQARYFEAYDATLKLWPVPVESFDVPTQFGTTHVHACGPATAPPLVLLHGQAVSSTMWFPNVGALSQAYRVYAPDTPGDLGKSVATHPVTQPDQFVAWLTELLDGLGVRRTHLAGLSMGGYLALRLALAAPERVNKLILMAPASLLPVQARYLLRMALVFLPPFLVPFSTKQRLIVGTNTAAAQPAIAQMLTPTDFRYTLVRPPVITDAELRQVSAPTLLLLGDHEVVYDPRAARERATRLIPNVQVHWLAGAGHTLNIDQPELVNRYLLEFLAGAPGERPG